MSLKPRQLFLITAGTLFTAIGIVGIFIPVLPTTPFLLLAAACYLRSSERFYHWLVHQRILGFYIRNYLEGKGMPLGVKLFTIFLLWLGIGISLWLGPSHLAVRIFLLAVAVGVTLHIILIKTTGHRSDHAQAQSMQEVYNRIAPGWYDFRHHSRYQTELKALAERWRRGRLLNVGCAHGPDFIPFKESFELYGVDFSGEMLRLAQKYAEKYQFNVNLSEADARSLPYADEFFDFAIAVAMYHHIEGGGERLKALRELRRVLKSGGEAFIMVWNKWQPKFWFRPKDIQVPWKSQDEILYRYYHLFSYGELEKLARQAGFQVIKSSPESRYNFPLKMFSRNICVLVKKSK